MALAGAGWIVYHELPGSGAIRPANHSTQTTVQIIIRPSPDLEAEAVDIPIEIYPVDIVAVKHEYFAEPPGGKRFDEFLKERMEGRSPISTRLDRQGQAWVTVPPGNWWLHASLSAKEDLEWRLPIAVTGQKQIVELTPQNAYTRSKSF
jgi:hypothetical protein